MNHDTSGWLAISTEGIAAMNAARPPEHLSKELVQNAARFLSIAGLALVALQRSTSMTTPPGFQLRQLHSVRQVDRSGPSPEQAA